MARKYFSIKLEFQPRDLWIGVYWQTDPCTLSQEQTSVWICIVPMFPIRISWIH